MSSHLIHSELLSNDSHNSVLNTFRSTMILKQSHNSKVNVKHSVLEIHRSHNNSIEGNQLKVNSSNFNDVIINLDLSDTADEFILTISNSHFNEISGKMLIVTSTGSNNLVMGMENSIVSVVSSFNINMNGRNGRIKIKKSNNVRIEGDDNKIYTTGSCNLKIKGNDNRITLIGSPNHSMKRARGESTVTTTSVQIVGGGSCSKERSGKARYGISCLEDPVINSGDYILGIFHFKTEWIEDGDKVRVSILTNEFQAGSYTTEVIGDGDKALLSAIGKNEKQQTLELIGPKKVVRELAKEGGDAPCTVFYVNL